MRKLDFLISHDLHEEMRAMAREAGVDPSDILRRGLAVLSAYRDARARGMSHIGFVADANRLDVEVINVL